MMARATPWASLTATWFALTSLSSCVDDTERRATAPLPEAGPVDVSAPTPDADASTGEGTTKDASTHDASAGNPSVPSRDASAIAGGATDAATQPIPAATNDAAAANDAGTPALDAASPRLDSGTDPGLGDLDLLRFVPYPEPPYPAENPHTDEKALLGKILFWEEQLSGDDSVACGTCHRGSAGGSDPRSATEAAWLPGNDAMHGTADDLRGSPGIVPCGPEGRLGEAVQVTTRKAPSYLDAMFARRLFWDGRAECASDECPSIDAFEDPDQPGSFPIAMFGALENQAVGPPMSTVEMACAEPTWTAIHQKLETATPLALASDIPGELAEFIAANGASYPELFRAAFGAEQTSGPETEINTRRIAFAIATHERRLRSNQTPWDEFNAGDDSALTPAQIRGLRVFRERAQCSSCHLPPLFSDGAFHFTGFHHPQDDLGREVISGRATDRGEMRTPTLRNVGLRAAGGLLHTGAGAGASLESVLATYVAGGLRDDPEILGVPISESVEALDLTPDEVEDLTDFLIHGLTDPRVAAELAPFDRPRLGSE